MHFQDCNIKRTKYLTKPGDKFVHRKQLSAVRFIVQLYPSEIDLAYAKYAWANLEE